MLDVYLQILLAVGLAIFCFFLVLGCIICWQRTKSLPSDEKEAGFSSPSAPVDHVTVNLNSCPSISVLPIKQQYEELEGDVLDYPSQDTSPPCADSDVSTVSYAVTDVKSPQKPEVPLCRLSSPAICASSSAKIVRSRTSLPSIRKLSIGAKKGCSAERRSTIASGFLYTESSQLTTADFSSSSGPQGEICPGRYGTRSSSRHGSMSSKQPPSLSFTSCFWPAEGTLTVTILGVFRASRRVGGAVVRASLPPLCSVALQGAPEHRQSADVQPQVFTLRAGSLEELQSCRLRLAVFGKDFSGLRETALGELELISTDIEWEPNTTITYHRQLTRRLKKSASSQSLGQRRASTSRSRTLGQIFILLQYQTQAHRIKVMLLKAEGLAKLTKMPGASNYHVIINLRHGGKVISTKDTKRVSGPNAVWNAPFLFDLPSGDITRLPLVLEFIVMQGRLYMKSSVLGRVLIGSEGPEVGQQHWQEMYSRGQMETTRWHELQSNAP